MKFYTRIIGWALFLNLSFWVWFWVDVWLHAADYTDRVPKFEEVVPVYKFGTKALPFEAEQKLVSFRAMLMIQRPAFLLAGGVANAAGNNWERRVEGGLSIGASVLIGTTLLSFAQWWAIVAFCQLVFGARTGGESRRAKRST